VAPRLPTVVIEFADMGTAVQPASAEAQSACAEIEPPENGLGPIREAFDDRM